VPRTSRRVLPATQAALDTLGAQIAIARREAGWTATELAERLGVTPALVARIERGSPATAVGTVLEAALLCGVPLFGASHDQLAAVAERQRDRLALLPARVRTQPKPVSDKF
jgi:transcriptional regulator with XRE-family HTH domain